MSAKKKNAMEGEIEMRFDDRKKRILSAIVETYIRTGEPMDKAGAYAIQGIAGMFVEKIDGSYSNVIGLPMALTRDMLMKAGIENL